MERWRERHLHRRAVDSWNGIRTRDIYALSAGTEGREARAEDGEQVYQQVRKWERGRQGEDDTWQSYCKTMDHIGFEAIVLLLSIYSAIGQPFQDLLEVLC